MKAEYLTCCVNSTAELIDNMVERAKEINVFTFIRRVNINVEDFGYVKKGKGLKLKNDWAVSFFKSIFNGQPCYYMCHSAIEYIYTFNQQATGRKVGDIIEITAKTLKADDLWGIG